MKNRTILKLNKLYVMLLQSLILNVKDHNDYFNCTKCTVEGKYRNGYISFADIRATKRTNNSFLNETDKNFYLDSTIFKK